jgi:hypothetical protein
MPRTFFSLVVATFAVTLAGACGSSSPSTKEPSAVGGPNLKGDPAYEDLCAGVPSEQQAKCPVGAWAKSVDDVPNGVVLHLNASAPSPAETQKRMRCHRAWMAHDPSNAMPRCPLGSPGISIAARAGSAGTDLELIASKPEDVQEVRKRTHAVVGP